VPETNVRGTFDGVTPEVAWLLLAYTLPPEPSRMRVSIWRRLRKLGAVYMEEGFWVLPNTAKLAVELKSVIQDIQNFQGTASAFLSTALDETQSQRLRSRLLVSRDEEYAELLGQCERFMTHIAHAISTKRYTFAEVEELEEEMSKLERWLEEIRSRDLFGSGQSNVSLEAIARGRDALHQFTERAFLESSDAKGRLDPPVD